MSEEAKMSTDSSDSENGILSEWTLIQPSVNSSFEEKADSLDSQVGYSSLETVSLESKIQDVDLPKGSDSSDIERISDEGSHEYYLTDGSQDSHFSFLLNKERPDTDSNDSSSSGVSVVAEDDNTDLSAFYNYKDSDQIPTNLDVRCQRTYTHTPNNRLNVALTVLVVLSVTLVFGMGVGHFLGWSSRWSSQYRLHQSHIVQLQALQEELVTCLQSQANVNDNRQQQLATCYEKIDYWKTKFEEILAENQVLQEFVDRTRIREETEFDLDEKCEGLNVMMVDDYKRLKFHLISQQLDNVDTLKKMEDIKRQEMETLERLKKLEEENEELKAHLEKDEGENDNEADEKIIRQLSEENQELKKELAQLTVVLQLEEDEDTKTNEEIGTLRQQINNLLVENSDLQKMIAKLRYTEPLDVQQQVTEKEEDSWLESTGWPDLHMDGFIEHLLKIATDKDAAKQELNQLQENLKYSYEELSKKAKEGLDTGKDILRQVHQEFESKFAAFANANLSSSTLSTETIQQIGKTLGNAMLKLYKIGADGISSKEEKDGLKGGSGVAKKIEKVLKGLEKQWQNIREKMWGTSAKNNSPNDPEKEETKAEVKSKKSENKKLKKGVVKNSQDNLSDFKEKPKNDASQSKNEKLHKTKTKKIGRDQEKIKEFNTKKSEIIIDEEKESRCKSCKFSRSSEKRKHVNVHDDDEENGNCTASSDNWFQARAKYRESARGTEASDTSSSSSWMFERASNRQQLRMEVADNSNWYLQRAKRRQSSHSSSKKKWKKSRSKSDDEDSEDDESDDDGENEKKKKKKHRKESKDKVGKMSKEKRRLLSVSEDDVNGDTPGHESAQWHKHHYEQQHFEWRSADSHFF